MHPKELRFHQINKLSEKPGRSTHLLSSFFYFALGRFCPRSDYEKVVSIYEKGNCEKGMKKIKRATANGNNFHRLARTRSRSPTGSPGELAAGRAGRVIINIIGNTVNSSSGGTGAALDDRANTYLFRRSTGPERPVRSDDRSAANSRRRDPRHPGGIFTNLADD